MLVKDILKNREISFSFEFFPPKTEKGFENLFKNIEKLKKLSPSYVSVTYGAGGTTVGRTHDLVEKISKELDITVVSHLTCSGSSCNEIHALLKNYSEIGISNILALRGDPPLNEKIFKPHKDGFNYASELVAFIKKIFPDMCVGVAGFPEGHPETPNRILEMEYLKRKVDEGADYIVTQLFFDNRDFYDFCERCSFYGINIPIIAGIMPVTSKKGLQRIAELAAGARIPAPLLKAVEKAADDEGVANIGAHWASEQVRDLMYNNVKGIHFYTLNKSPATIKIYKSLGNLSSSNFL
ncbi:MAG: methylenetetrahydrofolate reductase [NAD(P)H] [Deltaproteobacteria bacterium]|nr:MAG: methylenetetrahydrofolate reductase [NAD(P)H] [Deltaproteobacteria bacterium]